MNWSIRLFSLVKEPESSCFVKGLIRSMKETPEKWERHTLMDSGHTCWRYSFPRVWLWLPDVWHQNVHSVSSDFPELTLEEKKALTHALFEYLEKPYQAKIAEADKAKQRKLMEPFEKLGCPDQL